MDTNDRRAIELLFNKLAAVERQGVERDPDAEAFIQTQIERQPGAAYYMAQTIVVQEQALEAAQRRIEQLEADAARSRSGGGLFGSLFGGGHSAAPSRPTARHGGPWGGMTQPAHYRKAGHGGGGFLAGAAQTAVGVAGGVLLGNALADMFVGGDEAAAAEGEDALADAGPAVEEGGFEDFEV